MNTNNKPKSLYDQFPDMPKFTPAFERDRMDWEEEKTRRLKAAKKKKFLYKKGKIYCIWKLKDGDILSRISLKK